jgi:hypothetical protein
MDKLFNISEEKTERGDLEGKYSHTWVEESFNFESRSGKQIPLSHTRAYLGASIPKKNILVIAIIVMAGLVILFCKTAYLQVAKGATYRDLAEGNRIRLRPILSERGIIYDRFHNELVENIPNFSLTLIPQDLPRNEGQREAIINNVVHISGVPQRTDTGTFSKI